MRQGVEVVKNKEKMEKWTILKDETATFAFQEFHFLNEEEKKVAVAVTNQRAYIFKNLQTHAILPYATLLNGKKNTYYEEEIAFYNQAIEKIEFHPFAFEHLTSAAYVEIIQAIQNL